MLKLTAVSLTRSPVDILAVPVCEDADIHDNPELQELIAKATGLEEFSGEKDQLVLLYDLPGAKAHRAVFLGVGPRRKLSTELLRLAAGRAVRKAMELKREHLLIAAPLASRVGLESRAIVKALLEGAYLANHTFGLYKSKTDNKSLKYISLMVTPRLVQEYKALAQHVETICQATVQAREWVSTPANDKPPLQLAKAIVSSARKANLNAHIMEAPQLQKQKFGALLAVAAGSTHPPCLVELVKGPKTAEETIVLVGKGVTFDTGGINIKPSSGLETMKADMSGAAAVAGAMLAMAKGKTKRRLVGILPLVENMPSGSATRPGDIVTSYSGKTVEIGNTDAEGRLILIDAMAYAIAKYKPSMLIDLATLTGACVVALGERMAAVFSPDNHLAEAIIAAGLDTHERCWRMPLPEDYKELLKSDLADINNMPSTRYGGAITAALFLAEFVGDTRWAHIDIAGPAHQKKANGYCGPGGTGFGVRLLCELLEKI